MNKNKIKNINDWINTSLPKVVSNLEKNILQGFHIQTEKGLNISGRNSIYEILDLLLAVLFPGAFSKERIADNDLNFFIGNTLREVSYKLQKLTKEIFEFYCFKDDCDDCNCNEKSNYICTQLIEKLSCIRERLLDDVEAGYEGDPASKSMEEIVLSYPCIEAIATYRIAHQLYVLEVPIIPRIMTERAHSRTGIDIHPGATIGTHFFIDHGTGVVIGETTEIGRNVKIYQGVTLGALSPLDKEGRARRGEKRHPNIEENVIIYANATILGGKTTIGKDSIIGGNTWITSSVPPGSIVYSNHRKE
jgi:serine O-acetyltransferase